MEYFRISIYRTQYEIQLAVGIFFVFCFLPTHFFRQIAVTINTLKWSSVTPEKHFYDNAESSTIVFLICLIYKVYSQIINWKSIIYFLSPLAHNVRAILKYSLALYLPYQNFKIPPQLIFDILYFSHHPNWSFPTTIPLIAWYLNKNPW